MLKKCLVACLVFFVSMSIIPYNGTDFLENSNIVEAKTESEPVVMGDIEQVEQLYADKNLTDAAKEDFGTATLLLKSGADDFDKLGAEIAIAIGDGIYALSYADSFAAESAYNVYQNMIGIDFVEPDLVVETESLDGTKTENTESATEEITEEMSSEALDTEAVVSTEAGTEIRTETGSSTEAIISTETESGADATEDTNAQDDKAEQDDPSVTVAVIDTGINTTDQRTAYYLRTPVSSGSVVQTETNSADENGHGTQIAGILSESFSDDGLTPQQVNLLPVKIADASGKCTILKLYLGMESAMDYGADILNISMGTKNMEGSALLNQAVQEAHDRGIVVVTSAGNNNDDVAGYAPANMDTVITVGSVNEKKELSSFSNHGSTLDCVSYGEEIVVTGLDGAAETVNGTSYSAAFVTAELAKQMASGAIKSPDEADTYIRNTAKDLGDAGWDEKYGCGLIGSYTYPVSDKKDENDNEEETEIQSENGNEVQIEDTTQAITNFADSGELTEVQRDEMEACLAYGDIVNDINCVAETQNVYASTGLVSIAKTKAAELKSDIQAGYVTVRYFNGQGYVSPVAYHNIGNDAIDSAGTSVVDALHAYAESGSEQELNVFYEKLDEFYNVLNAKRTLSVKAESSELTSLTAAAATSAAEQLTAESENEVEVEASKISFSDTNAANQWQSQSSKDLYESMDYLSTEKLQKFYNNLSNSDRELLSARLGQYFQNIMSRIFEAEVTTENADQATYYVADEASLRLYNDWGLIGQEDGVSINSIIYPIDQTTTINLTSSITVNNYYRINSTVTVTSSGGKQMLLGTDFDISNTEHVEDIYNNTLSMFYVYAGGTLNIQGNAILNGNGSNVKHNGFLVYVTSGGTLNISGDATLKNNYFVTYSGQSNAGIGSAVHNDGTVNMSGGTISGNKLTDKTDLTILQGGGAAIGNQGGTVTVSGGEIAENKGETGGGIWNYSGTLNITGGSVHDNTGIYGSNIAALKLNGMSASINNTLNIGGTSGNVVQLYNGKDTAGIQIGSNCTCNISTAYNYIYGNEAAGIRNAGNLNISAGARIGFSSYTSTSDYTADQNASYGIINSGTMSISSALRIYASTGASGIKNTGTTTIDAGSNMLLFCDSADYGINNSGTFNSGNITLNSSDSAVYPYTIYGSADNAIRNTGSGICILKGRILGNYDVSASGIIKDTSESNQHFTTGIYNTSTGIYSSDNPYAVILSGTTISGTNYFGYVNSAVTGINNDTTSGCISVKQGKVTNSGGNGITNKGKLFIMDADAVIYSNAGVGVSSSGEVTLSNGTIKTSTRGIYNSGILNISGGTITANTSTTGGGIYNTADGTISMSGGIISDNTATASGAGIYNYGNVTVSGGTISGNSAATYGGGIMNKAGAVFSLIGGTICNNQCEQNTTDTTKGTGGGIYNSSADAEDGLAAGKVYLNSAFIYGNNNYGVYSNGTCYLASQSTPTSQQILYMGVSDFSSYTSYVLAKNTSGNIYNGTSGSLQLGGNNTKLAYARLISNGNVNITNKGTITCPGNTNGSQYVALLGTGTGIENSGTATINNGVAITNFSSAENRIGVINAGTLNLKGGNISYGTTGINSTGTINMTGGTISKNTAHGVYQNGVFNMSGAAVVDTSNDVCLAYDASTKQCRVITITGVLTASGVVAEITPTTGVDIDDITSTVIKKKGTVVVKTAYTNGKGSFALFDSASDYRFVLSKGGILRPGDYMDDDAVKSEQANGTINYAIADTDIAISTVYTVTYKKNIDEKDSSGNAINIDIKNFPSDQKKYWCETLILPNNTTGYQYVVPTVTKEPYASYYRFLNWNMKSDGNGDVYPMTYTYKQNNDLTLYAFWQKNFNIAYIGNEQSTGDDFTEHDISMDSTYLFNDNQDADGSYHYQKEVTNSYSDAETGEDIIEETTAKVVQWSLKQDALTDSVDDKSGTFNIGSEISSSNLYSAAKDVKGAITTGVPSTDYGQYPQKQIKQLLAFNSLDVGKSSISASNETKLMGVVAIDTSSQPFVNLYAVWDYGPTIEAYDLYYTLEEAKNTTATAGITEENLLSKATATDEEDGELPHGKQVDYGSGKKTSFFVSDYSVTDFTSFTTAGSVTINYRAIDTAGNITDKIVTVHIADTAVEKVDAGKVRFISKKYLNTLSDDSIWKVNEEYLQELTDVLNNKRINAETYTETVLGQELTLEKPGSGTWETPTEQVWVFTHEQAAAVKNYVDRNGIGNSKNSCSLSDFCTKFASCRQ